MCPWYENFMSEINLSLSLETLRFIADPFTLDIMQLSIKWNGIR